MECLPHLAIISTHEEAPHSIRHRETFALLPKQPSMMCPVSCCVLYEGGWGLGWGGGAFETEIKKIKKILEIQLVFYRRN